MFIKGVVAFAAALFFYLVGNYDKFPIQIKALPMKK